MRIKFALHIILLFLFALPLRAEAYDLQQKPNSKSTCECCAVIYQQNDTQNKLGECFSGCCAIREQQEMNLTYRNVIPEVDFSENLPAFKDYPDIEKTYCDPDTYKYKNETNKY